jgi:hypothetical protein
MNEKLTEPQTFEIVKFSESIEKCIFNTNESAVVIENALSLEQIGWLLKQQSLCPTVNKNPGILNFKYSKRGKVERFIEELITPRLGRTVRHGGSFVRTTVPFHVHTDTGKAEEMEETYFPFKNVLIPLSNSTKTAPLYTVFFHQRSLGQASHFWKGEKFAHQQPKYNFKVTDYTSLLNYTGTPLDREVYERHLTHLPFENLFGLSVEKLIEWRIGDVIIFDCNQLHSSNDFSKHQVTKNSLTYFASKVISDGLE